MKIVNFKEFLTYPSGTVFQKYEPNCFEDLCIKVDNCGDFDFFYTDMRSMEYDLGETTNEHVFEKLNNGEEVNKRFNSSERDALYEEDQLYAVWSKDDVKKLIERLIKTL